MKDVISRLQRELPDTEKDRYDVAYERGRAQARSGLLFGGLLFGALGGAIAMFLFDPNRGAGRRAQLASRATGIRNDLARTTSGRVEDLQNRAKGAAIETGIRKPSDFDREGTDRDDAGTGTAGNGTAAAALTGGPSRTVATEPIRPDEVERYGPSGPVAGAALGEDVTETGGADAGAERAERDATLGGSPG